MTVSDFFPEFFDGALGEGGHLPVPAAAAYIHDEAAQHLPAFGRMFHFRMKLNRIELLCGILHCGDRAVGGVRRDPESVRNPGNVVCMAHPADRIYAIFICAVSRLHVPEQQGIRRVDHHLCAAVFADRSRPDRLRIAGITCAGIHIFRFRDSRGTAAIGHEL